LSGGWRFDPYIRGENAMHLTRAAPVHAAPCLNRRIAGRHREVLDRIDAQTGALDPRRLSPAHRCSTARRRAYDYGNI
jgi:hypothetical protein